MLESAAAMWLDTHLSGFDHLFLSMQHFFADHAGGVLTPLMKFITLLGEKGWPFFLLAFLFMLTATKRDLGVCIFGAVCCGALITNIILKDSIARLRPFENSIEYELWWTVAGSVAEEGFSFPSGHVTACAAGMTAITLMRGKKWIIPSVIIVLLMAISRNYLMAHYPSDVAAAILIGVFSGFVSWLITQLIFRFLRRNRRKVPFFGFLLDFDIRDIIPLPFLKRKKAVVDEVPDLDEDVKPYSRKKEPAPARKARSAAPEAPARKAKAAEFEFDTPKARNAAPKASARTAEDVEFEFDAPARASKGVEPKFRKPADEVKAAEPAPEAPARPARSAEPKAESGRSGGRHVLPEGAASTTRKKSSGNYQGKH